ncbi:hypothetical protein CEE45_04850 [Candidatus Heimdallarchaeota archaeon B3_Heim]|nr:MAG: hypothetical protein CEE45_04850 [Candidatus Heimdallarchaeota archaeon B3_Heim]
MITKLVLKNWMSHLDTELKFSPGLNLIFGENGVGKTAVIHAIDFALSGFSPIKGVSLKNLVKIGSDETVVKLDFFTSGKQQLFRVKRKIYRDPDRSQDAFLFDLNYPDRPLATGRDDVNMEINVLLGLQSDLSKDLIFFKEGVVGLYLVNTPKEREKQFYDLLNLEKIEQFRKIVVSSTNDERGEKNRIVIRIKEIDDRLLKLEVKNLDLLSERLLEIENKIDSLKISKDELWTSDSVEINEFTRKKEIVQNEIDKLKESLFRKERSKKSLLLNYRSLNEMETFVKTLPELNTSLNECQDKIDKYYDERRIEQAKMDLIRSQRNLLESTEIQKDLRCPTCWKPLSRNEISDLLLESKKEISNLHISAKKLSDKIIPLSSEMKEIKDEIGRLFEAKSNIPQLSMLKEEIEVTQTRFNEKTEELRILNEKITSISDFDRSKRIIDIDNEIKSLSIEKSKIEKELNVFEQKDDEMKYLEKSRKGLLDKLARCEKKLRIQYFLQKGLESIIGNFTRNLFKQLIENIQPRLRDLVEIEFDGISIDPKDNILVLYRDQERLDFRHLSSGQKLLVYLAFRLALIEIFGSVDFSIVDEPSEHLDSYHCKTLRDEFFKLSQSDFIPFRQAVIAANDSRFSGPLGEDIDYPWQVVYQFKLDNGNTKTKSIHKKKKLKTRDELIRDITTLTLDVKGIPEYIKNQVKTNIAEGKTPSLKFLSGSVLEIMFQRLLVENNIEFKEIREFGPFSCDFIINIENQLFGVIIQGSSEDVNELEMNLDEILQILENAKSFGLEGVLFVVYVHTEGLWKFSQLKSTDLSKLKDSREQIGLKSMNEIFRINKNAATST